MKCTNNMAFITEPESMTGKWDCQETEFWKKKFENRALRTICSNMRGCELWPSEEISKQGYRKIRGPG